jgi:hypothetical protein
VFAVLWAIAHVGHVLRKADPGDLLAWLLLASAVLLIGKPSSPVCLGVLAAVQPVYLGSKLPFTDNHGYMMGFANLGLLVAVLSQVRFRPDGFRLPVRYLKTTFLVSYAGAAIAKLNAGFFDLETSCALTMFYDAWAVFGLKRGLLPGALQPIESYLPFLIAGTELLLPVLLMSGRTARLGVVGAVCFHLAISLSPTATALDFTLVVFAFVFLCLPSGTATRLTARAFHTVPALFSASAVRLVALGLLSVFLAISLATGWGGIAGNRNWVWLAGTSLALGACLLALALTERSGRSTVDATERRAVSRAVPYGALVALQLANLGAPYLGSKNVGSFVMYSNLQTERGQSNHFLLPRLPIHMGQDDLVEIVASSSGWLRVVRDRGLLISWHELRRHLAANPDASVAYRRRSVLHVHERAREDPELVRRDPVSHLFIGHRLFDPRRASCQW